MIIITQPHLLFSTKVESQQYFFCYPQACHRLTSVALGMSACYNDGAVHKSHFGVK